MERPGRFRGITAWEVVGISVVLAVLVVILRPVFSTAQTPPRFTGCRNNQKLIAATVLIYVQDHSEQLPRAETMWADLGIASTKPTPGDVVWDSFVPVLANGYVYNSRIAGKVLTDSTLGDPTQTFVTACGQHTAADGKPANVAYSMADIDTKRHTRDEQHFLYKKKIPCFVASFLDGHAEVIDADKAPAWF